MYTTFVVAADIVTYARRLNFSFLSSRQHSRARITQPRFIRWILALNIVCFVIICGSYVGTIYN